MYMRILVFSLLFGLALSLEVNAQESLRSIAKKSISNVRTVRRNVADCRVMTIRVPVIRRYGLLGLRRRVVFVERQVVVRVNRTVSESRMVSVMPVSELDNSAETRDVVTLDIPKSTGIVASQVEELLLQSFPANEYPMMRVSNAKSFPVHFNSTDVSSDKGRYQILVRPIDDSTNRVEILVYALDEILRTTASSKERSLTKARLIHALLKAK